MKISRSFIRDAACIIGSVAIIILSLPNIACQTSTQVSGGVQVGAGGGYAHTTGQNPYAYCNHWAHQGGAGSYAMHTHNDGAYWMYSPEYGVWSKHAQGYWAYYPGDYQVKSDTGYLYVVTGMKSNGQPQWKCLSCKRHHH